MSNAVRFILLAILAVGALLRFSYLHEMADHPDFRQPGLDAGYHDYWARAVAFGKWDPPAEQIDPQIRTQPYFRPPGYPYFLALTYQFTGGSYTGARIVQLLLSLVNIALAFWFVRRWYGSPAALVTAAICATFWTFIYYAGEFLEPVLLISLTWGLLIALGEWIRKPSLKRAAIAGVFIGLFALVRPNILVVAPFLAGWMMLQSRSAPDRSRSLIQHLFAITLATLLVVLPATLRNWVVAKDLVLISSNSGINLLMGQDANAVADHASDATGNWNCFDYPRIIAEASANAGHSMKASEVSSWYADRAWERIKQDPKRTARLLVLKTLLFWGPREVSNNKVEEMERSHSFVLRHLPLPFPLLAGMGFIGFVMEWRRKRKAAPEPADQRDRWAMSGLMALVISIYFVSFLPYISAGQYRVPVIPLLAAFTGIAAAEIFRLIRQGNGKSAIVWLTAGLAAWGVLSINYTGYRVKPVRWHLARGISADRSGQLEIAEDEYLKAIAINPDLALLPLRLGTLYARQERIDDAIEQFEKAQQLNPEDPVTHFSLGLAMALQGNVTSAIPHFVRTITLQPDHADAHYNLAQAYQMTGNPEKALEHRRRAVELKKKH